MRAQVITAATLVGLFAVTPSLAQTAAPASDKSETNCTTSSTTGAATKSADNSMAMEKNAILPSAGGHANSAAPTVQNDGKPMHSRADCPPETKK